MPAVERLRLLFPRAHLEVLALPWVAGLYRRPIVDDVIPYTASVDWKDLHGHWRLGMALRARRFDTAILLQVSLDAAIVTWLTGITTRIGYDVKRRG